MEGQVPREQGPLLYTASPVLRTSSQHGGLTVGRLVLAGSGLPEQTWWIRHISSMITFCVCDVALEVPLTSFLLYHMIQAVTSSSRSKGREH